MSAAEAMYWLYSLVLALLALGYLPLFLIRKVWGAGYPVALRERLGFVRVPPPPTPGGRFWVHAVSVGEVMAAVPLVQALPRPVAGGRHRRLHGDGHWRARGAGAPARRPWRRSRSPWTFRGAVRRAVRRVGPGCFIALETELWPNLLRALRQAKVPAVLANGRISDRSYRRYKPGARASSGGCWRT